MTAPTSSPVAVWRVTRTGQPVPGNLVGWGTADTLSDAYLDATDCALAASQVHMSDLSDDEFAVVMAAPVNPTVVELRDCTVEIAWDHAEVAS